MRTEGRISNLSQSPNRICGVLNPFGRGRGRPRAPGGARRRPRPVLFFCFILSVRTARSAAEFVRLIVLDEWLLTAGLYLSNITADSV